MGYQYERDDIYLCMDCGFFYRCSDDKLMDIPLSEIPAELAIDVMCIRNGATKPHHKYTSQRVRRNKRGRGFA